MLSRGGLLLSNVFPAEGEGGGGLCFSMDRGSMEVYLLSSFLLLSTSYVRHLMAISLPIMLVCAQTFCIVMLWVDHILWLIMVAMSSLSGWLC